MDISCGEVDPGNESAMDVDEGMDVCSDYETSRLQELLALSVNNTVLDANNSQGSMSNNATSEMGDSANTTVVLNSSFPKQQEGSAPDGLDKSTRFPLGIAKEYNQTINSLNSSKERMKSSLLSSPISNDLRLAGKENMFTNSFDAQLFEFPTETKREGDKFPLDVNEIPSVPGSIPAQSAQAEEEQFTPASDYIFSAADFDCLLSRGSSQAETATVTASAASSSQGTSTDLPRHSVLINFDPLLRRQTIVTSPDNNDTIGNLETTSACLALVDFAQQQQQQQQQQKLHSSFNASPLIPLVETNEFEPIGVLEQEDSSLVSSAVPDAATEQFDQTLTTVESGFIEGVNTPERPQPSETNTLEQTVVEAEVSNGSETIDLENRVPNQTQESCGEHTDHLSLSGGSIEQDFLKSIKSEKQYTQELFTDTSDPVVVQTPEVTLVKPINSAEPLCETIISTDDGEHQQDDVKETTDSTEAAVFLVSQSNSASDAEPEKDIETLVEFAKAPVVSSDDRMAQHEDENVDLAKKNKSEDINIADMEKKMHDVELREENMLKRITEKDKTISKMRKYDRMKKNAVKYKEHEEKLLEKIMKLEESLRAQEQRYEKMKSHAMSQLEIANTKIDEALRNHSQESAKLKAQIKKEELYRISINEQLIQKSKENEELVKICDELISETN
ncbi:AGAP010297-PA-like protein [Anopheles sinensis]|uniref:AGAP010297-PA-like protein n=1 Tax=Anopheles sinensis TaxID=74873 RepID=A0A084W5N2_ANOSI|nr:AGAP010297-PA-like protein [Anopheles sinensis]